MGVFLSSYGSFSSLYGSAAVNALQPGCKVHTLWSDNTGGNKNCFMHVSKSNHIHLCLSSWEQSLCSSPITLIQSVWPSPSASAHPSCSVGHLLTAEAVLIFLQWRLAFFTKISTVSHCQWWGCLWGGRGMSPLAECQRCKARSLCYYCEWHQLVAKGEFSGRKIT